MVWKHQLTTREKHKLWVFVTSTLLDTFVVVTNGKFGFSSCRMWVWQAPIRLSKKGRHHHQNYSNWATAGDSSSCLLPIGPENQNTGVALCLASASAAQRKRYRLSGIHGYSRIFFSCMFQPKPNFLRLATLQTSMSLRSGSNEKGSSCFFRWRQHWNHDKHWFSSTK